MQLGFVLNLYLNWCRGVDLTVGAIPCSLPCTTEDLQRCVSAIHVRADIGEDVWNAILDACNRDNSNLKAENEDRLSERCDTLCMGSCGYVLLPDCDGML